MLDRIRNALAEIEDMRDIIDGGAALGELHQLDLAPEQAELAILGLGIAFHAIADTLEAMECSE